MKKYKKYEKKNKIERYTSSLRRIVSEHFHLQKALRVLLAETRLTVYRRPRVSFRDDESSMFVLGQWLEGDVFSVTLLVGCGHIGSRGRGSLVCIS